MSSSHSVSDPPPVVQCEYIRIPGQLQTYPLTEMKAESFYDDSTCSRYVSSQVRISAKQNLEIGYNPRNAREAGRVASNKRFGDCLLVVEAKMPKAQDSFPFAALWLYGGGNELDLFEITSQGGGVEGSADVVHVTPDQRFTTQFYPQFNTDAVLRAPPSTNLTDGYHQYVVYRSGSVVKFYLDPVITCTNNVTTVTPRVDPRAMVSYDLSRLRYGLFSNKTGRFQGSNTDGYLYTYLNGAAQKMQLVANVAIGGGWQGGECTRNVENKCGGCGQTSGEMSIRSIRYIDL